MTDKLPDSHDGRHATEPLGLRLSEELCVTQRRSPADIVAEALDRYKPVRLLDGRTWDEVPG